MQYFTQKDMKQEMISPGNNLGIVVLINAGYPQGIVWNKIPFEIMNNIGSEWKK